MKLAAEACMLLALGLTPQLARGQLTAQESQCVQECHDSCSPRPGYETPGCMDPCMKDCLPKGPPRPFGAIAFGADRRAEGIAWNKGTQQEADQIALATCSEHGNNCRVVFRFRDTCAALAVAAGAPRYEAATGNNAKIAEANAIDLCQQHWSKCLTNLSACSLSSENRPSPTPPPRAISWGAIAYSNRDMGAGWSQGKDSRASAEKEAMDRCSQRGKACTLRTAFNKQCGALAADRDFTGWGTSANPREAQQRAMAECQKAGGTKCALHIFFCSF